MQKYRMDVKDLSRNEREGNEREVAGGEGLRGGTPGTVLFVLPGFGCGHGRGYGYPSCGWGHPGQGTGEAEESVTLRGHRPVDVRRAVSPNREEGGVQSEQNTKADD